MKRIHPSLVGTRPRTERGPLRLKSSGISSDTGCNAIICRARTQGSRDANWPPELQRVSPALRRAHASEAKPDGRERGPLQRVRHQFNQSSRVKSTKGRSGRDPPQKRRSPEGTLVIPLVPRTAPPLIFGDLCSDPTRDRRDLSPSPLLQLRSCHELIASRCRVVLPAEGFSRDLEAE
ncbi:hypothetical protein NL676_018824 [Syzygium grande]|nr:hypothetical protein NL676_018824 [Syzygium grande]